MDQYLLWLNQYKPFLSVIAGLSLLLLVLSLLATPWIVARLPSDYLQTNKLNRPTGIFGSILFALKALIGFILIAFGLLLFITPGPGLVVLLVGLSMAEFPGKHRLMTKMAGQPRILKSLNWMREKRGKEPFGAPGTTL